MPLTGTVLWYKNRPSDHGNHLHVEPPTRMVGIPPLSNPGMTDGVKRIYDALEAEFGPGAYFLDVDHHWEPDRFVIDDPDIKWVHMGGWNRRRIAGSTTWSQHSWWNALDIGPYYGTDQDRFYEFLTTYEGDDMAFTSHEETELKRLVDQLDRVGSNGGFVKYLIPWFRRLSHLTPEMLAELEESDEIAAVEAKLAQMSGGTVDNVARQEIAKLRNHLRKS